VKNFEWIQPTTVADAVTALGHPGAMPLAAASISSIGSRNGSRARAGS